MEIDDIKSKLEQIRKDILSPDLADREILALDKGPETRTVECYHCGHRQVIEKQMTKWICLECGRTNG